MELAPYYFLFFYPYPRVFFIIDLRETSIIASCTPALSQLPALPNSPHRQEASSLIICLTCSRLRRCHLPHKRPWLLPEFPLRTSKGHCMIVEHVCVLLTRTGASWRQCLSGVFSFPSPNQWTVLYITPTINTRCQGFSMNYWLLITLQ